jgi:hypothetical protein
MAHELTIVVNGRGSTQGGVMSDTNGPVGFETDIKPMFRESDRQSMRRHFDLWSHDDVSEHAESIVARLREGTMPCDGAWPEAQVDLFQRWAESGKAK